MPRLAKQFTVLAVDLRGIEGSTPASDGYDAANMAEDICQLALGLRANGCTHVETGLIQGAVHYLLEDQPDQVAGLIERYASLAR
jgi:pimeloyl-ACP methyl ester carboxylesterase